MKAQSLECPQEEISLQAVTCCLETRAWRPWAYAATFKIVAVIAVAVAAGGGSAGSSAARVGSAAAAVGAAAVGAAVGAAAAIAAAAAAMATAAMAAAAMADWWREPIGRRDRDVLVGTEAGEVGADAPMPMVALHLTMGGDEMVSQ